MRGRRADGERRRCHGRRGRCRAGRRAPRRKPADGRFVDGAVRSRCRSSPLWQQQDRRCAGRGLRRRQRPRGRRLHRRLPRRKGLRLPASGHAVRLPREMRRRYAGRHRAVRSPRRRRGLFGDVQARARIRVRRASGGPGSVQTGELPPDRVRRWPQGGDGGVRRHQHDRRRRLLGKLQLRTRLQRWDVRIGLRRCAPRQQRECDTERLRQSSATVCKALPAGEARCHSISIGLDRRSVLPFAPTSNTNSHWPGMWNSRPSARKRPGATVVTPGR